MDSNNEQKIAKEKNSAVNEINGIKNENVELENELTEKMSSSSMKEKASDNAENLEEKAKKRINFGGWLQQTLDWIKRTELAESSLCTSSSAFEPYWWPNLHGWKVKPHCVPSLAFSRKRDDEGNWQTILMKEGKILIPIADVNPPEYISGFEEIIFQFIDDQVLQFVQHIFPLLKMLTIGFKTNCLENSSSIRRMITMLASKTYELKFRVDYFNDLNKFNQLFPNFINGVQSIDHMGCTKMDLDLLIEWLMAPREDGKPKLLTIKFEYNCYATTLIERLKEEFDRATEPANFFITMLNYVDEDLEQIEYENFQIWNEKMKEILLLRGVNENYGLIRCNFDGEAISNWKEQMKPKSITKIWIEKELNEENDKN